MRAIREQPKTGGERHVRLLNPGFLLAAIVLLASLPAAAVEVVFETDVFGALVTVTTLGLSPMTSYAFSQSSQDRWACTMDLEPGKVYAVKVTHEGRTASGSDYIRPDREKQKMLYLFNHEKEVPPKGPKKPPKDGAPRSTGGDSWAPVKVILMLTIACVGAVAFVVWFLRRPTSYVYSVSNTNLSPPDDWPSEITWTYRHLVPLGKIASGGLATVYLVQDARYGGAYFALKVLHEQFCRRDEVDLKARFLDEPTIMQHLAGTGYVPLIYDRSRSSFLRPWFEMEYLDGMQPMRRMVGGKAHYRMETAWLLPVMLNVTHAIRKIHNCGVVHRDLSPENIMLSFNETVNVKIIDFGGAKYRRKTFSRDDFFHNVTIPGQQIGKVHYTAPELWREGIQAADFRSDAYSVAVIFWEMTTGEPPFAGNAAGQVRQDQVRKAASPTVLRKRGVPSDVAEILAAMLSPDRNARPGLDALEGSLMRYAV